MIKYHLHYLITYWIWFSSQSFELSTSYLDQNVYNYSQGPSFVTFSSGQSVNPLDIEFYNSTGVVLKCKANGNPMPTITWVKSVVSNIVPISNIPNLRHVRSNGEVIIYPFASDQFRQDIHLSSYRCAATNTIGTIVTPDINIRAIIKHDYKLRTADEFVLNGNAGQLSCLIPASLKDFVKVIYWQRNDGRQFTNNSPLYFKKNFYILQDGKLFFEKINQDIVSWKYRCVAIDLLNREEVTSTWAKFIIKDTFIQTVPRIVTSNTVHVVSIGDTLQIGCIAQANPVPSYKWLKDVNLKSEGSLFSDVHSLRPVLVLKNIQVHEEGVYTCIANNTLGEDRKKFKIKVLGQPMLTSSKVSKLIKCKEGESVTIDCLLNENFELYSQSFDIEWLKDGRPVNFGFRIKLTNQSKLKITSVIRDDRGMYQCIIKRDNHNRKETFFATFQLYIQEYAPELRSTFKSHLLQQGLSIGLKCIAFGSPLPQVRWFFYNKLLSDQSYQNRFRISDHVDSNGVIVSYLNITNITRENGGLYSCEAISHIGSVKHSAKINVYGSPYVHQMDNITVVSSQKLHIDCPISGHPIDSISWRKDDEEIPISRRIKAYSNGTVILIDARLEDKGWYHCHAKVGQLSAHGSLYVDILEKPVINPFMFGNDLREGMRATVICSILSGDSPLSLVWYKGHQLAKTIHPEIEILSFGEFTSTFQIKNVKRSHSGNYTCTASTDKVSVNYTTEMIVQASPKWLLKPRENYSAIEGKSLIIDCQAEGYPPPIHQWKKLQGKIIGEPSELIVIVSGPHVYVLENGSLVFNDIHKSQNGDYVCEASNRVGSSLSALVKLQVKRPVRFKKNFEVIEASQGNDTILKCEAFGDEPITITWFKDRELLDDNRKAKIYHHTDVRLEEGLQSILKIPLVDFSASAFFTCQASNPHGHDEKNIQLIVRGPPKSISNILVNKIESRQITLSWTEPINGNGQILVYIIQYTFNNTNWNDSFETISVNGNDHTAVLTKLKPDSYYKIRMFAQNTLGKSKPSEEIKVKTDQEAPSEIPSDLKIEPVNARSLKIYWRRKSLNEKVDGYLIGYRKLDTFHSSHNPFIYKTLSLDPSQSNKLDFSFVLFDLKRNTKYGIVVEAFNKKGSGNKTQEALAQTLEFDPPNKPIIRPIGVSYNKVTIEIEDDNENPISGYLIKYKSNIDDWEELKLLGSHKSLGLENLKCGTKYSLTVKLFNHAGFSEPSELIHVSTSGNVPSAGPIESLLTLNSTFVLVHLSAWSNNGCPILSFLVQYREHHHPEWIMLSNNILPKENQLIISDLSSATWYELLIIATSEAGSTESQYLFATLTSTGATIAPLSSTAYSNWKLAFNDPIVLAPICCTIFVFIIIFVTILFISNSRSQSNRNETNFNGDRQKLENLSMTSLAPHQALIEGKKIYELPRCDQPIDSYYTSYIGNRLSCNSDDDTLRRHNFYAHSQSLSSNQTYDVPFPNKFRRHYQE